MLIQKKCIGSIGAMAGVPSIPTEFFWSFVQMQEFNREYLLQDGEYIHLERAYQSFHALARNYLWSKMKGDWMLMLDTDHSFEPDLLVRMVRAMEFYKCDVLTAIYVHRQSPHPPVIYHWQDVDDMRHIMSWPKEVKCFPIDTAGAGCLLVKKKVFDRIWDELGEKPFAIIKDFGEDHSFFWRLKTLGIKPYAASRIESFHLMTQPIGLADVRTDGMVLEEGAYVDGLG